MRVLSPSTTGAALALLALAQVAGGAAGCRPPRYEDHAPGQASFVRGGETLVEEGEPIPLLAVDGRLVTLEDFLRRVQALPEWDRRRVGSAPARELLLEGLQGALVLAAEAEAAGMDADPMVRAAVAAAEAEAAIEREAAEQHPPAVVTDEEIAAWYEARRFRYQRPASARLYLLVVETEDEAEALRLAARAEQNDLALGERATHFAALAAAHSVDEATRARGGDLGFLTADEARERFGEALATELVGNAENVGRILGPVGGDGVHALVFVAQQRVALDRDLEEVQAELRVELEDARRAEARAAWLAEARAEAGIEVDEAALALLRDPPGPTVAPVEPAPIEAYDEVSLDALLNPVYDLGALPVLYEPPAPEGSGEGTGAAEGSGEGTGVGEATGTGDP